MKEKEFKPGDRFVIEIAGVMKEIDGERCKQLTDDTVSPRFTVYRIKGFNTLVFDETGLSRLVPYCEAVRDSNKQAYENGRHDQYGKDSGTIEQLTKDKENAYEQGLHDGRYSAELKQAEYKRGYMNGKKEISLERCIEYLRDHGWMQNHDRQITESEYRRGLEDAWSAVSRIESYPSNGGLTNSQIAEVFGECFSADELYNKFSAEEAMDLLNRWEKKQKADPDIKVGDVLKSSFKYNLTTVLVTCIDGDKWHVVQSDGMPATIAGDQKKFWKKTNTNVPLKPVLDAMKEKGKGNG